MNLNEFSQKIFARKIPSSISRISSYLNLGINIKDILLVSSACLSAVAALLSYYTSRNMLETADRQVTATFTVLTFTKQIEQITAMEELLEELAKQAKLISDILAADDCWDPSHGSFERDRVEPAVKAVKKIESDLEEHYKKLQFYTGDSQSAFLMDLRDNWTNINPWIEYVLGIPYTDERGFRKVRADMKVGALSAEAARNKLRQCAKAVFFKGVILDDTIHDECNPNRRSK